LAENTTQLTADQKVTKIAAAGYSSQGVAIEFTTLDGAKRTLAVHLSEVPHLIAELTTLAQRGAQLSGALRPPAPGERVSGPAPMEVVKASAVAGPTPGSAVLVVHTGAFPLAFSVPAGEVRSLAADLDPTGKAATSTDVW
jgi:hypothetical protein